MNQKKYNNWYITQDKDNIVWLALDKADSKTNVLSAEVLTELEAILALYHNQPPRGLVLHSGKSTGFIAGADVKEFTTFASEADALATIQRGQRIFNTLEELPCTTVAVLTGYTLGGGMELSLACNYRIADNSDNCRMGLPEVKLGIHPGFGGSVRSIELIGPINAMDMMLTGRNLRARAAKKIGLVDYAVPERHLMEAAKQTILKPPKRKPLPFWVNWINQAQIRPWFAKLLIKKVSAKAERAHYPAPYALIDLWVQHYGNRKAMLHEEALSVSRLLTGKTAQNLIRVFELQTSLKSLGSLKGYKPKHVHVIGGGVMGGDIAAWCALQGFQVSIQDQKNQTLAQVIKRAFSLYKKRLKKPLLISQAMDKLSPDIHGAGLVKADIVIEAIFEDAEVKRELFSKIEPLLKDNAIIATNTSSIPLEELTSSLKKPERLVGLHFFNPVAMMPLVEIVIGQQTSEEAQQKASAFTKQISRLPLPVSSSPGFLVNRVLMPYLMEAVILVEEGIPLKIIDKIATDFGMPMGPIELADTVGLDICLKVAQNLGKEMNLSVPEILIQKVEQKKLGKKSGEGFYRFVKNKAVKPDVDKNYSPPADIQNRLVMRMLNEVTACLRDGVVKSEDLADAGIIFGTGFAPFRGGPFHYIHERGVAQNIKLLENLVHVYGDRFTVDEGWNLLKK